MVDEIRAGDVVKHLPSCETWVVAATDDHHVFPVGWPPTMGEKADCELKHACSDENHWDMVEIWAKKHLGHGPYDSREAINFAVLEDRYRKDCESVMRC